MNLIWQVLAAVAIVVRIPARPDHRFLLTASDSLAGAASDTLAVQFQR